MRSFSTNLLLIAGAIIVGIVYLSTFIVDRTQFAVEIRLGDPVSVHMEPGLKFKMPFITKVFYVDNRLLTNDSDPGSVFTEDKKEMIVDAYSKWKVSDPLKFYETVRSLAGAQSRLDDIIYSQTREILGKHTLVEIVSGNRRDIRETITANSREAAESFGIEVADVRIKRADLPEANSLAVYGRMEAERRRTAKLYRSEGEERSLEIRSAADRDRIKILAEANKIAEELKGTADASATEIYASAYQLDSEFFEFQRSHDAYRHSLRED
ncbi:MAG: protease modulator HflC, partial [Deltaproteobacteria bacterium]